MLDREPQHPSKTQQPPRRSQETLAIRFPLPPEGRARWRRWHMLLPVPWRRRVVIQGRRYWQPG